MSKHTPGPWVVVPSLSGSENHRGYQIVAKPKAWSIVTVQPLDQDGLEGGANARLIAAAPDLLEELKEADEIIRELASYVARHAPVGSQVNLVDIRLPERDAAIAKAEGK